FACTATMWLVVTLYCAAPATAQTTSSAGSITDWYAEVNAAATLGHRSSSSIGAEGGYRFNQDIDVFVEGGHIFSVGSSDLDRRANVVAAVFGGTANASFHVTYLDVGVRYHIMMPSASVRPHFSENR